MIPDTSGAGIPDLSIVHPWDPWKQGIGGFDTCLDGFLRYAPPEWGLELIGLTTDSSARPVGIRQRLRIHDRQVTFLPVLYDPQPDTVRRLPLVFRYAAACAARRVRTSGRIVQYHRFEAELSLRASAGLHVLFLHMPPEHAASNQSDLRWRRLAPIYGWLIHRTIRRCQAVVGVDPRTRDWVDREFPRGGPDVIWLAEWADPAVFRLQDEQRRETARQDLRRRLALPSGSQLIVYAGRFEAPKDLLFLLEAFAQVLSSSPNAFLLLVGKGRLAGTIARRAEELGLRDHLRIEGPVDRPTLADVYRSCDVAVCASLFEGGPRQVFEALACGTPVVSTDVGQVAAILQGRPDIGLVVQSREVAAFAGALASQLATPHSWAAAMRCAHAVADYVPWRSLRPVFDYYHEWLSQRGFGAAHTG